VDIHRLHNKNDSSDKKGTFSMKCKNPLWHLGKLWSLGIVLLCLFATNAFAEATEQKITVAAAADLKFAMDEIISTFTQTNKNAKIDVTYGASGKLKTQIEQGAPFDLFFSADIIYPQDLEKKGLTASKVKPYAFGRIVLWSGVLDATKMTLDSLTDEKITKIAIANPKSAPYGKRAEEALRAAGLWDKVEPKLVYGENIAQTAQFVQSGNAQVGVLALSLAVNQELASKGGYYLIPDKLHSPLEQGHVLLKRAENNPLAKKFAEYMEGKEARAIMEKYGFTLPKEAGKK
jgi:molybdate transport system substrate-binding protein